MFYLGLNTSYSLKKEGSKQVEIENADIAVSKQSSHLIHVIIHDILLVRITTLIDNTLECLFTSPKITKISVLKGRKIRFTIIRSQFFYYKGNGIPRYEQVILITNKKNLNLPEYKKFIQALKKLLLYQTPIQKKHGSLKTPT